MTTEMPRVIFQSCEWFLDVRLREMRNVHNPQERMTWEDLDALAQTATSAL